MKSQHPSSPEPDLHSADIVSFDVFDTLLARPFVRPTDVFVLARDRVNAAGDYWVSTDWPTLRIAAEQAAYRDPKFGPDITIDDIYDTVAELADLPVAMLGHLRDIELATELDVLKATARGTELYRSAQRAGKRIFVLSDMYLPPETIAEALRRNGFEGWERLVVSGYDKLAKYNGSVYRSLKEEFPGQKLVHIGDNEVSDVIQPRLFDFEAIHLKQPFEADPDLHLEVPVSSRDWIIQAGGYGALAFTRSVIWGLIENWIERTPSRGIAADIGYSVLGPALVGFSQWLDHEARVKDVSSLAFLAREGRIMRQAYRELFEDEALPSRYVYASRRMVNLARITRGFSEDDLDFLTASGVPLTVQDYVTRFFADFPVDAIARAAKTVGLRAESLVPPEDARVMRTIFALLEGDAMAFVRAERAAVTAYMTGAGLDDPNAAVVDIGWQGSIQRSLRSLLNPTLQGFYFGVHDTPATAEKAEVSGYVDGRTRGIAQEWHQQCLVPGIEVVELLFGNPDEPSVLTVTPRAGGAGSFDPVFSRERMTDHDATFIRTVQRYALEFVRDYRDATRDFPRSTRQLPMETALALLGELVMRPTAAQAASVGRLLHDNSHGVQSSPLGLPRHRRLYYRFRPAAYERELHNAWWKAGFSKNLESQSRAARP